MQEKWCKQYKKPLPVIGYTTAIIASYNKVDAHGR